MSHEPVVLSVVIPTWNGRDLLEQSVPSVVAAMRASGVPYEIIIVDDASTDDTIPWLEAAWPELRVIARAKNGGFSQAINTGLLACSGRYALCINSDMVLQEDCVGPLLNAFTDIPDLFAATMYIEFPPGKRQEESGWTYGIWEHSAITIRHRTGRMIPGLYIPVLYPGGGSSLYDLTKLRELGYFAEVYSPFYYEDSDLGVRAWQQGWPSVLVSDSRALHIHRGTIGRNFSDEYINSVLERNRIIFHRCVLSGRARSGYLWRSRLRMLKGQVLGHQEFTKAWTEADRRLNDAAVPVASWPFPLKSRHEIALPALSRLSPRRPKKPLDILMVCAYSPYPPTHGGAVRMFNTIQSFVRAKQEFIVVVLSEQQDDVRSLRTWFRKIGLRDDRALIITREGSPPNHVQPGFQTDFDDALLHRALEHIVWEYDIRVAWLEYTQLGQYVSTFAPSTRVVLVAHDIASISYWRHAMNAPTTRDRLHRIAEASKVFLYETNCIRTANYVLTVSDRERAFVERFAPRTRVITSPTGMAIPEKWTPSTKDREGVLFVGSFRHRPNVEGLEHFLTAIWPKVKQICPTTSLRVVGGPIPQDLRERHPDVEWKGYVEDLEAEYRRCRVAIAPVYVGAGIRIKVLESLANGVATVTTPIGAEGLSFLRHGRDLLVARSDAEFVTHLRTLLEDGRACETLGRAGRKTVIQHYSWDPILARTLEEITS